MKETLKEYSKNIKELLNNKVYIITVILVAILAYGFTITNHSIGIDDLCFDRYVTGPYLLSAGRWGTTALYCLLGIVSFTPFWLEMVVTLLTITMGIIFTAFIKKESSDKLKTIHYSIITTILISYPMLHQSFIYQSTNFSVILSNLALMIIPILIYENFMKNKEFGIYMIFAIILPFFISMYESCCQTYMCIVLIIAFIKICNSKKSKETTKKIIKYIIIATAILFLAIIINNVINNIIFKVLANKGMLQRDFSSKGIPWTNKEYDKFSLLNKNILAKLKKDCNNLAHVKTFLISAIIVLAITIVKALKEKKYMLIPIIVGIIGFNFAINLLQIKLLYRINTSWCISIAFFTYVIMSNIKDKYILNSVSAIFCIIIFSQTRIMNQYFYNDYIRYQKEKHYIYEIANDIIEKCEDTTKPIVYLFDKHDGTHQKRVNQDNGWSLINWGSGAFDERGSEITKFINSLGYNFTIANEEEQKKLAEDYEKKIIKLVEDENIYETDDYILVVINYNV